MKNLRITPEEELQIISVYGEAETEEERNETVGCLAVFYDLTEMAVRQILQAEKVYVKKEGKTEKEQYASALWAVTNIKESEWMKLTLQAQKDLMAIFRGKK